ncbi:hypothetical protein ADIARSV_1365 [Arcticibacter svalbardensis MN12-7]|uniref:Two component regulator three Y domain-containing protein n=1 Tax=Arcticibacter svalbardensis MN12-7 TaxID=1150600 RepID=R9H2K8_9SPHI|nr:triple tyrosine motif-containing protein [Arcticibacter svalbardensis]EOR95449.1 hypothetical protein ADIARSV_1365 [Arcticibacter svalbardensis MN12-7]
MLLRIFFFVVVLLTSAHTIFSQSYIGQRETVNFVKRQYNAGTQNWKIRQDAQGRMYFANNEGLLVFDGASWQLYPLPNRTIVWSIEFGKDKRLYIGGQDEIGYFSPAKNGLLTFTSLKKLLPKTDQEFSDIWDIVSFGNDIFFRSRKKIFRYSKGKIIGYPPLSSWLFLGLSHNHLIAHDEKKGLLVFKKDHWQTWIDKKLLPPSFYITSVSEFGKDTSLITTAKDGLYLLAGTKLKSWPLSGFSIDNYQHFSGAIPLADHNFLLSTYTNGIYQVDRKGKVVENLSKKEGLQNANVRSLFMDVNRNVWLGLDNGIDFIAYNNAVKHINPPVFQDGGGYSTVFHKNSLYFALTNGIYKLPVHITGDLSYAANNLKLISGGQSWQLEVVDNTLLAGRDDGLFKIVNDKLLPISTITGFWIAKPLINNIGSSAIVAGNYYGIRLFKRSKDTFIDKGDMGRYYESARFLEIDKDNMIWTSHPYRGVYKISPGNSGVETYTQAQGLPSTLNNFVFKVKNRVVIATQKGIYEYNKKTNRFQSSIQFKKIFGNRSLRYLKEDPSGNIWFVEGKSIGVVDFSSKPVIINFPELNERILSGFENVYPINNYNIFVGSEKGFYHINFAKYKQNIRPLKVFIRKVKATANTDSLLYGGYFGDVYSNNKQTADDIPSLGHLWNSLHFEYSSPIFEEQPNLEYSYLLDGFNNEWSGWSKKQEKDYTNLPAGTYMFKIKSRDHHNNESSVSAYSFSINPPWYQTQWAFLLYLILGAYLLYFVYKIQERRHIKKREKELLLQQQKNEEEQRHTAYLHRIEMEISEKEVIKLKNEKLEAEIEHKASELASAALNIVQKKEFLLRVKEGLQRLEKSGKETIDTVEIKKIVRLLSEEKKINEEWEQFSVHFDKVHTDFLKVIKERYPSINQPELKLCAYLIMNLSSKEIALLMAISVRGVEISRYRLRKKLQISTETNLFEFLFSIQMECMK